MPDSKPRLSARWVLLVGVLATSTGAIWIRLADAPPLVKATWRTGLATLLILPWVRRDLLRDLRSAPRSLLALSVFGGLWLALHFGTWIASLEHADVATSTLLVGTTPIWVGLLGRLAGDPLRARTVQGLGVALLGSALLAYGSAGEGSATWFGSGLALAGAVSAGAYVLCTRRLGQRLALGTHLVLCYGTAALLLLACTLMRDEALLGYDERTTWALLGLTLIPQLLGHSSCNLALRTIPAVLVSMVLLFEPLLTSLYAWLLLDERPGATAFLAAPLIVGGLLWAARADLSPRSPRPSTPSRAS